LREEPSGSSIALSGRRRDAAAVLIAAAAMVITGDRRAAGRNVPVVKGE